MKSRILIFLLFNAFLCSAQDLLITKQTHTQIFSLSPISKKVDKVNGLVFGVGHFENKKIKKQTINGLNIEANPAPIAGIFVGFLSIIYMPEIIKNKSWKSSDSTRNDFKIKNWNYYPKLNINGINLSSGCFFVSTHMNGLTISLGNKFEKLNGISIAPLGTLSDKQNGMSVGIINANTTLCGVVLGLYNQTHQLNGLQMGMVNQVRQNNGIQIGIFNKSFSRGLQFGIWNNNSKHSFPIINW